MTAVRSLVVVPNWVGDVVMAEPVLRALAASGREIAVLAKPGLTPLLRLMPSIHEVIERGNDERAAIGRVAAGRFDEAVILPNSFRAAWLPYRAGIPRRFGYRGELRGPLLEPALRRPRRNRPQIEDYRELLAATGAAMPASFVPRLDLAPEILETGRERLRRANLLRSGAALVGLFPGAEWGPSKRWPMPRFASLATELRRRIPGVEAVILVGPKEVWLGVRVFEESGKIHPVIGPDLDLAGLAGVLAHLDLLISNDSGPMHLAAALGVRCVALFGPTDPRRTAPAGAGHRVVDRNLWCSPCFQRSCPLLHHRCMKSIAADEVAGVAVELVAGARSAPQ